MLPAAVTVTSVLTDAGLVVAEFDGLIALVLGLAGGVFVVSFLISKAKSALRG